MSQIQFTQIKSAPTLNDAKNAVEDGAEAAENFRNTINVSSIRDARAATRSLAALADRILVVAHGSWINVAREEVQAPSDGIVIEHIGSTWCRRDLGKGLKELIAPYEAGTPVWFQISWNNRTSK